MKVIDLIRQNSSTAFSFEVLPPKKGRGIDGLQRTIERLREFDPKYINITTHHSEYVYSEQPDGSFRRSTLRRRPGTVAVAAAIQHEYGITAVPHILCQGFTQEETEYVLIDLQFLGIENLLLLRGDKPRDEKMFVPTRGGYAHTTELQEQVNAFNRGTFLDGSPIETDMNFSYGVACYPEKHEEAPNLETDFAYFRKKVELGADYGVTQLFYDNAAYLRFCQRVKEAGMDVPVIPGIKPLTRLSQLTAVPKTFHCDFPEPLAHEALKCRTDEEAKALGIEWAVSQCKELIAAGVPSIHFYTMSAVDSVAQIAKQIY
ncbi:methylenetetrahydrofolate reductase [NAD(P)H] [uncultured Alloprevotella sp.]|jgi:methylenetetrahydrofolate reductase (NAD(P)H)|uniref:methylenetetrahydrofolate reductase [NAD(P)H] n=1 Tax=uncultured Alloprevotella sp. TaxID=1283315 RepID=UPI00325FAA78